MDAAALAPGVAARHPRRVRHALRFRALTVRTVRRVTPNRVRITLAGEDLADFASPGFDDHVKLIFPGADGALALPELMDGKPVFPAGAARPVMRDYTPLRHDAQAGTLEIEFALHEAGPATAWALRARAGQVLGVGGPRGSFIVPTDYAGHLLVGDDTALPAIARRLAELPAGVAATVVCEVASPADELPLYSAARLAVHWVHRADGPAAADPERLLHALAALPLPAGDCHAWVACESAAARALRAHLVDERGLDPKSVKAAAYWKRGAPGAHENLDE